MVLSKSLPEGASCVRCGGYITRVLNASDRAGTSQCVICSEMYYVKKQIREIPEFSFTHAINFPEIYFDTESITKLYCELNPRRKQKKSHYRLNKKKEKK